MKTRIKLLAALAVILSLLAGCGGASAAEDGAEGKESVRLMVWSGQKDQAAESDYWLQSTCEDFAALHPEWDITFVYGVVDNAADSVSLDPDTSADVFFYANDNITKMTESASIARFGGKYLEEIESFTTEALRQSLTVDGSLYGIPHSINTWFMFYDKSVFSEEDILNLDQMLTKGAVAFPFTNSWYLPSFYFGNGCTMFGDGTDEEAGVDFGGENAVEVTDYLIDLVQNPNFKIDSDGSGIAWLRDGTVSAIFSGTWDAPAVREILGENTGMAALPCYTLNGEEKQMKAYAGSGAIGVNAYSQYMVPAVELAVYLASKDAQMTHYELGSTVPCNLDVLADPRIKEDQMVIAQNDTFNRTAVLQPFVSGMTNCWSPVENMGKGILNGSVTHENANEQTQAMNEAMNSSGIQ